MSAPSGEAWQPRYSAQHWLRFTVLFVAFTVACQWLYSGWLNINSDQFFYSVSLDLFAQQLWQGDFYPRMLYDADGGAGVPVFLIYGPLPFYVSSLFYSLLGSFLNQLDFYLCAMGLAISLSVAAHYHWLKEMLDKQLAAMLTLAFALMPFKIINLHIRTNLAYFYTLTFFITLLWCTERMLKGKPYAWFGIVFSMAAIYLSHVPSVFIIAPVPFVYVLFRQRAHGGTVMPVIWKLLWANICAALLVAFFVLPAVIDKSMLVLSEATNVGLNLDHDFIWWNIPFIVIGFVLCVLTIKNQKMQSLPKGLTQLMALCLAVNLFMLSPLSSWLWEHVFFLGWIQMPFRFIILADVFFGLLTLLAISNQHTKRVWIFGLLGVAALMHAKYMVELGQQKHPDMAAAREYHMIAPAHDPFRTIYTPKDVYHVKERINMVREPEISIDAGTVSMERKALNRWEIIVESPERTNVHLRKYHQPNMMLKDLQRGYGFDIYPDASGMSVFNVDTGKYQLELSYQPFSMQREAYLISLLTLLGLLAAMLRRKRALGLLK